MTPAAWLVDAQFVMKSTQELGKFDYLKLRRKLEEVCEVEIIQAHFFNSHTGEYNSQNKFHDWLKRQPPEGPGFIPHLTGYKEVRIKCRECETENTRNVQKGTDVALVTKMLTLPKKIERILLCAGDGDFSPACAYLHERQVDFDIIGMRGRISADLAQWGKTVYIEDFWSDIEKQEEKRES